MSDPCIQPSGRRVTITDSMAQIAPRTGMSTPDPAPCSHCGFPLSIAPNFHPPAAVVSPMHATNMDTTERGPSSFASKNPFRNLIPDNNAVRPISTNPFLDTNEISAQGQVNKASPTTAPGSAKSPSSTVNETTDIFVSYIDCSTSTVINPETGRSRRKGLLEAITTACQRCHQT